MMPTRQIQSDPVVSHLLLALDTGEFKQILQQQIFNECGYLIDEIKIERIKYKPAKNCLVCYRLSIAHCITGKRLNLLFSARFYESGGSHSRYLKTRSHQDASNRFKGHDIPPVIHLPDIDCLIWVFPSDRKLNYLKFIDSEQTLREQIIPVVIQQHWGQDWALIKLSSEQVHYLPEHACCFRVQLALSNKKLMFSQIALLYTKTYYNQQGLKTFNVMTQLWNHQLRKSGRLNIPQPVCYQSEYRMLWQLSVPGCSIQDSLNNGHCAYQQFSDIARQVAALHQSAIEVSHVSTRSNLCRKLKQVFSVSEIVFPEIRSRLARIILHLFDQEPYLSSRPHAVLHGDLHLKNILVDSQQIYLIDLDDIQLGDPLQDIGSLIAAILYQSVLQNITQSESRRIIQTLLSTYQQSVDWTVDLNALRWFVATALIHERIARSISRLKQGRLEIVSELVELADSLTRDPESLNDYFSFDPKKTNAAL